MSPHSSVELSELSTAMRRSRRSSRFSAREVRRTARIVRSVVYLPMTTGARSGCSTNFGTSRALISTTSAWPPAKAANWSNGWLTSKRTLWSRSQAARVPESSSHCQMGSGDRAMRMTVGAARAGSSPTPATVAPADRLETPPSPLPAQAEAAPSTATTASATRRRRCPPAFTRGSDQPSPAAVAGSNQPVRGRMHPHSFSTQSGSAPSTRKPSEPYESPAPNRTLWPCAAR